MITLLLCAAFSQKAVICNSDGNPAPVEVPLGEPLFLSSTKSEAGEKCVPLWEIDPPERAERARFFDGGKSVVIGTGLKPVTITVRLIVAKGDNAAVSKVTIKAGGATPPGPEPGPLPPGPAPPSKFGMDGIARNALLDVADASRRADLAKAYRKLGGSAYGTLEAAATAQKAAVKAALGSESSKWQAWSSQVGAALNKLITAGKVKVDDVPTVFNEIAQGLE